jgi:opacity protein-like surface antigen
MPVIGLACLLGAPASSANAEEWEWELSAYVWASDASLDASIDDTEVSDIKADFDELIKKLDIIVPLQFEGRRGRTGLFAQLDYVDLSDEKTYIGSPGITDGIRTRSALEQLIVELGGFYEIMEDSGLDVLFGFRLLELSLDVDLDSPIGDDRSLSQDQSLLDGFAGLRYRADIGERWSWWARADVGTGGTEMSLQGTAGVALKLGRKRDDALYIGYRHLQFETEERGRGIVEKDLALSGPILGYRFGF